MNASTLRITGTAFSKEFNHHPKSIHTSHTKLQLSSALPVILQTNQNLLSSPENTNNCIALYLKCQWKVSHRALVNACAFMPYCHTKQTLIFAAHLMYRKQNIMKRNTKHHASTGDTMKSGHHHHHRRLHVPRSWSTVRAHERGLCAPLARSVKSVLRQSSHRQLHIPSIRSCLFMVNARIALVVASDQQSRQTRKYFASGICSIKYFWFVVFVLDGDAYFVLLAVCIRYFFRH